MSRQENIEIIRKACIAAKPELAADRYIEVSDYGVEMQFENIIGLADVLCLPDTPEMLAATEQENALACFRFLRMWNLRKDDLTEQSDETLAYLVALLKH